MRKEKARSYIVKLEFSSSTNVRVVLLQNGQSIQASANPRHSRGVTPAGPLIIMGPPW